MKALPIAREAGAFFCAAFTAATLTMWIIADSINVERGLLIAGAVAAGHLVRLLHESTTSGEKALEPVNG